MLSIPNILKVLIIIHLLLLLITYLLLFSCSVVLNSLRPHALQHTRLPCPSLFPGVCSNLCSMMFRDAIQPSPPLSSPFPPAFSLSQHQDHFQWAGSSHQVAKVLEFQLQHQSFQWILRVDLFLDWLVWFPCCSRDSQDSSLAPQFKSNNSLTLSLLYSSALNVCTWLLEKPKLWLDGPLSVKWCLCFLICCLGLS